MAQYKTQYIEAVLLGNPFNSNFFFFCLVYCKKLSLIEIIGKYGFLHNLVPKAGLNFSSSFVLHLAAFKNLQSLEICGGGLTDAGVKNIREIVSLTQLNLSQNCNLTDKTLELISGIFFLPSILYIPLEIRVIRIKYERKEKLDGEYYLFVLVFHSSPCPVIGSSKSLFCFD